MLIDTTGARVCMRELFDDPQAQKVLIAVIGTSTADVGKLMQKVPVFS